MIGVGLTGDFFGHYVKIKKGVVRYVLALAKSGLVPFFEPKVEIWLIPPILKLPEPPFLTKNYKIVSFAFRAF